MKEQYKELIDDIVAEEKAIEETLKRLFNASTKFDSQYKDHLIEPAMGTYLMNFYNGVENILKRIAKKYYLTMPKGANWHRELLDLSANPPLEKVAVFNQDIIGRLHIYKNFRHRFISGYGFQLKGEKMLELINDIKPLWVDIKMAISDFVNKL